MSEPVDPAERAPGDGYLVLWLGGPGRWEPEVQAQLEAAGVRVEDSGLDVLVERAGQRAPDLIVLTGAAAGAPKSILARLSETHPARTVPIVAIGGSDNAKPKARARFGCVAQLDQNAAEAEITKQLLGLLRGLSRRPAKWRIKAGRAEVPTISERFGRASRSGLLTAKGAGGIAFDQGTGIAPPPEMLVNAISDEDVEHLTFYERAPGQIRILDQPPRDDETAPPLDGARVLVIDGQLERAQRLAVRLEGAGAQARALALDKTAIIGARSLDPTLVIVGASGLAREACEPLWVEPRLASAALLVLSDRAFDMSPARFLSTAGEMCTLENGIRRRLEAEEAIAERLATLGTARWLKVLGRCKHDVTFRVFAATGRGRVDIKGGRVRGAAFRPSDTRMAMVEGRAAVDMLLALPFGRVLAGPRDALRKLEGVRGSRKMSLIGRVTRPSERTKSPVLDRHGKGLVAEEVVTSMRVPTPVVSSAPNQREVTTRPPEQPSAKVKPVPRHDEFEEATRNYTASAMEGLRAELRNAAKVSEPLAATKPPEQPTKAPTPVPAPELREPETKTAAPLAPPGRASRPTPRPSNSLPNVATLPKPILSPRPLPQPAEPERPKPNGGSMWFVAGIALALGVGGYAAWQLSRETPSAETPSTTSPVNATPNATADANAIPSDLSSDETASDETAPHETAPHETAPDETAPDETAPSDPPSNGVEPEPAREHPIEPGAIQLPESEASVERLIEQAIEAARAQDYPQSEIFARQALAQSPHHAVAAYRLGVALYRQRRHEEALTWAERSTQWDPTEPRAHSIQGDIHMRTGHFRAAARAYQAAIELEANYGPALRGLERLRERGVVE